MISFIVHYILCRVWPPTGLGEVDGFDSFGTFSSEEAAKMGVVYNEDLLGSDPAVYEVTRESEVFDKS